MKSTECKWEQTVTYAVFFHGSRCFTLAIRLFNRGLISRADNLQSLDWEDNQIDKGNIWKGQESHSYCCCSYSQLGVRTWVKNQPTT